MLTLGEALREGWRKGFICGFGLGAAFVILLVVLHGCGEPERMGLEMVRMAPPAAHQLERPCLAPDGCFAYPPACRVAWCYCPAVCGLRRPVRAWRHSADDCGCA